MPRGKFGHWASLFKSFHPRFYQNIVSQSFGRSLVYIILLSFLLSLLLSVKSTIALATFIPQVKHWAFKLTESWPTGLTEIKIEKGKVTSAVAQPYTYKWEDFTFVLDTTGRINSLNDYKQGVLITENKIIFKTMKSKHQTEINEYDLSNVESFVLRQGDMNKSVIAQIIMNNKVFDLTVKMLKFLFKVFCIVAFFAMLISLFFYYLFAKIIQALIFSLLALIPNRFTGANLTYKGLLNIALYSLTPATILAVTIILAQLKIPAFWFIYCVIYGLYLVLGMMNIRDSSQASVTS